MYYNSIKELIGGTPLIRLGEIGKEVPHVNIFAKLELWNPSGCVKDRVGMAMIKDAEERGLLHKGSTIVEATAGSTGLGISLAALNKGYHVIFVIPEKFSREKQILIRSLGAEIINTKREDGMQGAALKAEEIRRQIPGAISLKQFENPQNPKIHYETTGREIYNALEGEIDYFILGAGSGGTFSGVMKYLKEKNPNVKGILADPVGSTMGGGEHGDYNIEGIGNDFIAATMDMELVDEVVKVTDEEAFKRARELALKEGIIAGSSSGAALSAVLSVAGRLQKGNIVTLFPDRGDRYFTKNLYESFLL